MAEYRFSKIVAVALAAAGFSAARLAAAEDTAVVVGINIYPKLQLGNLSGCVNDARDMANSLRRLGFKVAEVFDRAATRAGIIKALQEAKPRCTETDRFVFYYAGHGTDTPDGKSVLLPHDAEDGSDKNDLKSKELYDLVKVIPAASRTVVLDSCFAGGMLASSRSLGRNWKTRYYRRKTRGSSPVAVSPNAPEIILDQTGPAEVCYFAASRNNEQAHEDTFNGRQRGVFTYFLLAQLGDEKQVWGELQTQVGGKVSQHTDDLQHPMLTPQYASRSLFERLMAGGTKPPVDPTKPPTDPTKPPTDPTKPPTDPEKPPVDPPKEPERSVWDRYNEDRMDPAKVKLTMEPDRTTMQIGDKLRFSCSVGIDGWLVILERGTSGKLFVLHPSSKTTEDARVAANDVVTIPAEGQAYAPDAAGNERIKAVLFTSKSEAESLLEIFRKEGARGMDGATARHLTLKKKTAGAASTEPKPGEPKFFTSDVIFEVTQRAAPFLGAFLELFR